MHKMMLTLYLFFGGGISCQGVNLFSAQDSHNTRIDSDNGMVCDQQGNACQAEGNIKITRDNLVLTCKKLKVQFYKSPHTGKHEVSKIYASNTVRAENTVDNCYATGNRLEFDAVTQKLVLSENPFLYHPKITIKNASMILFDARQYQVTVSGHGTAISGDRIVQANKMVAQFMRDPQGKIAFNTLTATDDVILSTPTEIGRAQRGFFDNVTRRGELINNVLITNSNGQIQGSKAVVDLNANTTQIIENKGQKSRTKILLLSKQKPTVSKAKP